MLKRKGRWVLALVVLIGAGIAGMYRLVRVEDRSTRTLGPAGESARGNSAEEAGAGQDPSALSAREPAVVAQATAAQTGSSSTAGELEDLRGPAGDPSTPKASTMEGALKRLGAANIADLPALEARVQAERASLLGQGLNVVGIVKLVGEVPPPFRVEVSPACTGAPPQVHEVVVDGGETTERKVWRDVRGFVDVERVRSIAGGVAEALVYLEGAALGPGPFPPPDTAIDLRSRSCRFVPALAAARTGQLLRVVNDTPDLFTFDLYASIEKHRVVLPGKTFEWRPPLVGERAQLKNNTEPALPPTWLAVFDHPFFAVTTLEGLFALGPVPPGDHPIILFHPILGEQRTTISVQPNQVTPVLFLAGPAPR